MSNNGVTDNSHSLSGVERDIVLEAIRSRSSVIIVQAAEQSMVVQPTLYSMPAENLLFFTDRTMTDAGVTGECAVCFFYHGRGMFFRSILKKTQNGMACVIPPVLYRQPDTRKETGSEVRMRINSVECFEKEGFPLFKNNLWTVFPKDELENARQYLSELADLVPAHIPDDVRALMSRERKILYLPDGKLPVKNYFPFDATITAGDAGFYGGISDESFATLDRAVYIPLTEPGASVTDECPVFTVQEDEPSFSPLDISEIISLLPACRYLSRNHVAPQAVQGRILPYSILYMNDCCVVLGLEQGKLPLRKGEEYPVDITVKLPVGKRTMHVTLAVTRIFTSRADDASCVMLRFIRLEEEDRRFIYERYYGTRYV